MSNTMLLEMPSTYCLMDKEEMSYTEGGGTIRVVASAKTVQTIARGGTALVGGIVGQLFGGPILAKVLSAGLTTLIFNVILEASNYTYKGIDTKFTNVVFPDATINLNHFV